MKNSINSKNVSFIDEEGYVEDRFLAEFGMASPSEYEIDGSRFDYHKGSNSLLDEDFDDEPSGYDLF